MAIIRFCGILALILFFNCHGNIIRSSIGAKNGMIENSGESTSGLLEWISSESTEQWVQTGIKMTPSMGYEVDFITENIGTSYQFNYCGGYAWTASAAYLLIQWAASGTSLGVYVYMKSGRAAIGLGTTSPQKVHVIYSPLDGVTINGIKIAEGPIEGTQGTRLPYFVLFGRGREDIATHDGTLGFAQGGIMKISYARLFDENGDIMRLLPYLTEDGVACFFDEVSGSYLYSAGAIELTAGPRKE